MAKINKATPSGSIKSCATTTKCPSGILSPKTSKKAWS